MCGFPCLTDVWVWCTPATARARAHGCLDRVTLFQWFRCNRQSALLLCAAWWCGPCAHPSQVRITPLTTKRVEHSGVKVQLLGQIELASERGHYHDFVALGTSHWAPCAEGRTEGALDMAGTKT
jgi:hypothetical protein